jgi:MinD-like ATPase involved in chromosome partitioning or flagellar assembly
MTEATPAEGHIVTFYSYKGGTGRSMALANVAWILASQGKRVLVIDWDLEAPGVHRYFHPFLRDKSLASSEGLMEFVVEYVSHALAPVSGEPLAEGWWLQYADIVRYAQSLQWPQFKKPGTLDLIPAGRQVGSYAGTVNLFNWHQFYDKLGGEKFFEAAKQHMRADYDYILIDSRTGVSDTSGICTVQMPETVVVCFTFNIQSIEGAAAVAETITLQREKLGIPVRILPVPTRVDSSEKDKVNLARVEAWRRFDPFLARLSQDELARYWGSVEMPYVPWYSFEEVLATFGDRKGLRTSLLSAMETLTAYVSDGAVRTLGAISEPERLQKLGEFQRSAEDEKMVVKRSAAERGEQAMARLPTELQVQALSVILRMGSITAHDATRRTVPRKLLNDVHDRVLSALRYSRLIVEKQLSDGSEVVELAGEDVLNGWTRVERAIDEERPFLMWRQKISDDAAAWETSRERSLLLRGQPLEDARRRLRERPLDFNASERGFLLAGEHRRTTLRISTVVAALLLLVVSGIVGWKRQTDDYQVSRSIRDARPNEVRSDPTGEDAVRKWIDALVATGHESQARQVAATAPAPAQRAVRLAALAVAMGATDSEASKAIAEINAPGERARALVSVANLFLAREPAIAARLGIEAVPLVRLSSRDAVPETVDEKKPGSMLSPSEIPLAKISPAYWKSQLDLMHDLIVLLQNVAWYEYNESLLHDADVVLDRVSPADRVEWLLVIADAMPRPDKNNPVDLGKDERKKALKVIASISDAADRSERLLRTVDRLLRSGDLDNAQLILEEEEYVKSSSRDAHDVLARTMQALALQTMQGLGPRSVPEQSAAIWIMATSLRNRFLPPQSYELLADEAAARAALHDPDASREIREVENDLKRVAAPNDLATIEASLSFAYHCLGKHETEVATRKRAEELAQMVVEPQAREHALMSVAMSAARSGDVSTAARISQSLDERLAEVEAQKTDLALLAAEAAGGLDAHAAVDDAAKIIQIASRGKKDQTLLAVLHPIIAGAKADAAIAIVRAIGGQNERYQGLCELTDLDQHSIVTADLQSIAATFTDPFIHSQAILIAANHERESSAAHEARTLVTDAEKVAMKVQVAEQKSKALADVAEQYAKDGDLHTARQDALECTVVSDQLRGFAALVTASALRKRADAAKAINGGTNGSH